MGIQIFCKFKYFMVILMDYPHLLKINEIMLALGPQQPMEKWRCFRPKNMGEITFEHEGTVGSHGPPKALNYPFWRGESKFMQIYGSFDGFPVYIMFTR